MPITYDPDTNTITIVGTKDGQPYCFEDIYQADVNNGWNKFTKLSEGVYKTTAKIKIGDGTTLTLFADELVTLIADNVTTTVSEWFLLIEANADVQFGKITEVNGNYVTYNGVTFLMRNTNYGDMKILTKLNSNAKFYDCAVHRLKDSIRAKIELNDAEFIGNSVLDAYCVFNNCKIINCEFLGYNTHINPVAGNVISNVFIYTKELKLFWLGNRSRTINGITGVSTNRLADIDRLQTPNVIKFVNCRFSTWNVRWYLAEGDVSGELQRIYAVRFKVTDINGNPLANRVVKVYDKNGNLIVETTTDSNGLTDEVEILYAKLINPYSDGQWHTFDEDDWEYFNPYVVEVWYGGELEYKGILTDLDIESTFIQITVKPSSFTINDLANKIEYVRKLFANRWKIENNELKIYDDDNQTVIRRFKLYDKEGKPTETNVYDRVPV